MTTPRSSTSRPATSCPMPIHNNWALGEIVNGWQLSNYTTYEDGAPYQAESVNMNTNYQHITAADADYHPPITCRCRAAWQDTMATDRRNQTWFWNQPVREWHLSPCGLRSSQGPAEEPVLQPQLLCSAASANRNDVRTNGPDHLALHPHAALLRQRSGGLQGIPGYRCSACRGSYLGDQLAQPPQRANSA